MLLSCPRRTLLTGPPTLTPSLAQQAGQAENDTLRPVDAAETNVDDACTNMLSDPCGERSSLKFAASPRGAL